MTQNMSLVFLIQIPNLILLNGFSFSLVSLHLYDRCATCTQCLPRQSHWKSLQARFFPYLTIDGGWFSQRAKNKANTESLLSAGKSKWSQITSKHILILDTWFPLFFRCFSASWLSGILLHLLLHTAVDEEFARRLTWEIESSHARGGSTASAYTKCGFPFNLWATRSNKV